MAVSWALRTVLHALCERILQKVHGKAIMKHLHGFAMPSQKNPLVFNSILHEPFEAGCTVFPTRVMATYEQLQGIIHFSQK